MSITVEKFLTTALTEIRVARGGDVVNPDDMDLALTLFNELLDLWNAQQRAVYARAFTTHTLTPNLQPHTIGLTANTPTFVVTIGRPSRLLNANLILPTNIRSPIGVIDDAEWNAILAGAAAGQAVTIATTIPTVLNYRASWPNGAIYLWPVPTAAYGLELETETLLASVALSDTLDLPFGYQQALRLTLAELAAPSFGQQVSQSTAANARAARALIFGDNDVIPNVTTWDAGLPGVRGGGYNFRTGMVG